MNSQNNKRQQIYGIIKYVSGLLGFLGIIIAILTVTGGVEWFLFKVNYLGVYTDKTKLILSLSSSILGIFFLFVAFSKQIDKFFGFLETHTVTKPDKEEETKGITIELIFFLFIGIVLILLAILLGIGSLVLRTNLPLLGTATEKVLIGALIVLAILAIITAFNRTISQSLKEMKKVHWPSSKDMVDYSKRVFSFIVFFSLFFFALDLILTYTPGLINKIFNINL